MSTAPPKSTRPVNMSPTLPYGEPVVVSPVVRGARLLMLVAGIGVGVFKYGVNKTRHEKWKVLEAKKQIEREKMMIEKKKWIAIEEKKLVKEIESM